PENDVVMLPSTLGKDLYETLRLKSLIKAERELRCGQANDALDDLRLELSKKAFLHVEKRGEPSKDHRTRGWAAINQADEKVKDLALIYRTARRALVILGLKHERMEKYQPLLDAQLTSSTTLLDTTKHGQTYEKLPWFWACETGHGITDNNILREFQRSHWLRTREHLSRASEESNLVQHEMKWTVLHFEYRAKCWKDIGVRYGDQGVGHKAYALRQRDMWLTLAADARAIFR
ncbi:hypothetical protein BDN72DRAFT_739597, partial [Pluteus cervinus]